MQVEISADHVAIWLSSGEGDDPQNAEAVRAIIHDARERKLLPIVFISGEDDIKDLTIALLQGNRALSAD